MSSNLSNYDVMLKLNNILENNIITKSMYHVTTLVITMTQNFTILLSILKIIIQMRLIKLSFMEYMNMKRLKI